HRPGDLRLPGTQAKPPVTGPRPSVPGPGGPGFLRKGPKRVRGSNDRTNHIQEGSTVAKLLHTRFRVSDLDRSIRWYCDNLGFTLTRRTDRSPAGNQLAFLELPGN